MNGPIELDLFGNERPAKAGRSSAPVALDMFEALAERAALESGRPLSQERLRARDLDAAPAGPLLEQLDGDDYDCPDDYDEDDEDFADYDAEALDDDERAILAAEHATILDEDSFGPYQSWTVCSPKEGHEIARAYVTDHPDDTDFREYFDRCQPGSKYGSGADDHRYISEWYYVPSGRKAPKQARACYSKGCGMSGPGSRGEWLIAWEMRDPRTQPLSLLP